MYVCMCKNVNVCIYTKDLRFLSLQTFEPWQSALVLELVSVLWDGLLIWILKRNLALKYPVFPWILKKEKTKIELKIKLKIDFSLFSPTSVAFIV